MCIEDAFVIRFIVIKHIHKAFKLFTNNRCADDDASGEFFRLEFTVIDFVWEAIVFIVMKALVEYLFSVVESVSGDGDNGCVTRAACLPLFVDLARIIQSFLALQQRALRG